jgi:hypothetical protein
MKVHSYFLARPASAGIRLMFRSALDSGWHSAVTRTHGEICESGDLNKSHYLADDTMDHGWAEHRLAPDAKLE